MSKRQPLTYEFPKEIRKEYYQLMASKESFLKQRNLSSADVHKLITLYEELENAWNRNHTEGLKRQLEESYKELRAIQKEIESGGKSFKADTRKRWRSRLDWRRRHLEERRQSLNERKADFWNTVKTWKQDIIERENFLETKRDDLNQRARQRLNELKETWRHWEQTALVLKSEWRKLDEKKGNWNSVLVLDGKREKLTSLQEEHRLLSMILSEEERIRQHQLERLRTKLEERLRKQEEEWKANIERKRKAYRERLKRLEDELLKQLRIELAKENSPSTDELKMRLIKGDYYYLSAKDKVVSSDLEQLNNYLTRELTKIGYSLEGFVERMERNR